jgi:hypothetical protein
VYLEERVKNAPMVGLGPSEQRNQDVRRNKTLLKGLMERVKQRHKENRKVGKMASDSGILVAVLGTAKYFSLFPLGEAGLLNK